MKRLIALSCGAAFLSACAGVPVSKPFTGDRQSAPIHDLSVAVIIPRMLDLRYSDESLRELVKKGPMALATRMGAVDPAAMRSFWSSFYESDRFYRNTFAVYHQDFKTAILLGSIDDPRAAAADLIAVPEVTYSVAAPGIGAMILACELPPLIGGFIWPLTTDVQVWITSTFYAPDHSLVATIKASSPKVALVRPAWFIPKLEKPLAELHQYATNELDTVFENSPELAQYARSLASKRLVAVAPARPGKGPAKVFDSDVDRPGYSLAENADDYAVIVGVETYQTLQSAEFAKRDAEAVRAHLHALGYPLQNIALLTDSQATGNKIKSYLESWLPKNVKPGSKVFFYFSGHGAPDTDTKEAYLMPWDGDPQFVETGYPLKRLYRQLGELKAKQIVVAMDSGFSGAGGRSVLAKGARPLVSRLDEVSASELGRVVALSAAGGDEIAGIEEAQGHGLFTYYMLKAFNEPSGLKTLEQVYARLKPQVADAARRSSRGQTPQLQGANPEKVVIR